MPIRTRLDREASILEAQMLDAPTPSPDVVPDVIPQMLPVRVSVPEPTLPEPIETSDPDPSMLQPPAGVTSVTAPVEESKSTPPDFEANYLSNPSPLYPPLSRRRHEEGMTTLRVHVEPDGKPTAVEIEQSSGFERLDRAAIAAVRQWSFVPAQSRGTAVAAWVLVPVRFSLEK
ncbi:MAG: TonB family protein [Gammaproteobacteria bacterium]